MAKAWPDETIGIIKFAIGGTSLLAWKPDWKREDADRVRQGPALDRCIRGSWKRVGQAKAERGHRDRRIPVASRRRRHEERGCGHGSTLENLKSLVAVVRKDTGVADLPFLYGSARIGETPDDLSDLVPKLMEGRYPAAQWVVKAQFDAQKAIPNSKMVILRDIERLPQNVHYNTAGQLKVGKLFAEAYLSQAGRSGQTDRIGGRTPLEILAMLGAKGEADVQPAKLEEYRRIFRFIDANDDGNLSSKEFVDDGRYMTRQTRQEIFGASDANSDGVVSEKEYVTNRIITDEAKAIMIKMDESGDGKVARKEFIGHSGLPEDLSQAVFNEFDTDGSGELVTPEYLRIWGRWARRKSGG